MMPEYSNISEERPKDGKNGNPEDVNENTLPTGQATGQPVTPNPEPSTLNPEPSTSNMEVHHHPNLHHKKKHWKEYFLEFLMIFLAVTLGFFAESYREYLGDRSKEREFMHSMIADLQEDTINMNVGMRALTYIISGHDSWKICWRTLQTKMILNSTENYIIRIQCLLGRIPR